jgi:chemotaxis signal transduction protein
MPPAMVGVVTVRGTLTAVYSPHQSLGLSLASSEAVLIFRRGGARVGILIDDVEDAIAVDLRELRRAPGTDGDDTLVLGVVRHEGALLAIVDADALIAACQSAALLETA